MIERGLTALGIYLVFRKEYGAETATRMCSKRETLADILYVLDDRAAMAEHIAQADVDGFVAVVVSSMDCDCSKSVSSRVIKTPTVLEWQKIQEQEYEGAEGPMFVSLVKPNDAPESFVRDLALEAFEDGHPHVVYA